MPIHRLLASPIPVRRRLCRAIRPQCLFGAATFLTWNGRIKGERTQAFLARFFEDRLAEPDNEAWIGWLGSIALLGLRELVPLVDDAWKQDLIPEFSYSREDFDFLEAEQRPDDIGRSEERWLGPIEDTLEALQVADYVDDDDEHFQGC
ncbi:hypothetical protein [Bradyrhizobium cenepequi]|uniref:hypothetical protein n=1 Tax=Bradyrhizobium cenepequi TaxID=2821403 RepID=UPI001CE397B8|nr:hypothetical protein [Bradyrhizobium cenepequi]MCA6109740.1 hypothetical protein [Bradyrhizobium cenepequi]